MNKEQIDEIALTVMSDIRSKVVGDNEQIKAFAHALLAELAKVSEPIAWTHTVGGEKRIGYDERLLALPDDTQLFTHPPQQADLTAEIERLKAEHLETLLNVLDAKDAMLSLGVQQGSFPEMFKELRQQLSAMKTEWEKESIAADNWSDKCEELCQQLSAAQSQAIFWEGESTRLCKGDNATINDLSEYVSVLEGKLSEAQADNDVLVKALEKVAAIMKYTGNDMRFPCVYESANKAIAAHKAGKQGENNDNASI